MNLPHGGRAATALLLALHLDIDADADQAAGIAPRPDLPAHITIADIDTDALDALHAVADRAGIDSARLSFVHVAWAGRLRRKTSKGNFLMSDIIPFTIEISDSELRDLRERLRRTRWPEEETVTDWS
jgi:hypothetical protein